MRFVFLELGFYLSNPPILTTLILLFPNVAKGTPGNGVFEKWDKQAIQKTIDSSPQPPSPSHPQSQLSQGQRLSTDRGIFRSSRWLCNSNFSKWLPLIPFPLFFAFHLPYF